MCYLKYIEHEYEIIHCFSQSENFNIFYNIISNRYSNNYLFKVYSL